MTPKDKSPRSEVSNMPLGKSGRELVTPKLDLEMAENQRSNSPICWVTEKSREFQKKKNYFCFINYPKAFDCVDHNKLCKALKEMGISDHLNCILRNLYASQEPTVRTRTWNNGLVPNWEKSTTRLYIVTLLT